MTSPARRAVRAARTLVPTCAGSRGSCLRMARGTSSPSALDVMRPPTPESLMWHGSSFRASYSHSPGTDRRAPHGNRPRYRCGLDPDVPAHGECQRGVHAHRASHRRLRSPVQRGVPRGLRRACPALAASAETVRSKRTEGDRHLSDCNLSQLAPARSRWRAGQVPAAAALGRHSGEPIPGDGEHRQGDGPPAGGRPARPLALRGIGPGPTALDPAALGAGSGSHRRRRPRSRRVATGPRPRDPDATARQGAAWRCAAADRAGDRAVRRHPPGTRSPTTLDGCRGRVHRGRGRTRRAVLPARVQGGRCGPSPAGRPLWLHVLQPGVHPADAARPGRKQRARWLVDLLRLVRSQQLGRGSDVPVLAPVDGHPDDDERAHLPERDGPHLAQRAAPGRDRGRAESRMTVLVTGAAGFLGGHVTDLLLASGERPRVLIRPGESLSASTQANVDVHRGDVGDRATLEPALQGVDRVLHCAARCGPWGPAAEYESTNVRALETLVRAALAAGVRRLVHVSSITVHGNDVKGAADESTPLREEPNPYSRSKVAGERLLARMIRDEGAPVTIVRPGWIYGPRDRASFARIARVIDKGRMVMVGAGGNHLPLIYARDAARGVLLASEIGQATGKTYLLINDESVTQRDYIHAIAVELGAPAPKRRIPYRLGLMLGAGAESLGRLSHREQAPPVMRYGMQLLGGENRFTITRARRELGFAPQVDLAEGVRRSVEWYRATNGAEHE